LDTAEGGNPAEFLQQLGKSCIISPKTFGLHKTTMCLHDSPPDFNPMPVLKLPVREA
jgi:hypothetical protein